MLFMSLREKSDYSLFVQTMFKLKKSGIWCSQEPIWWAPGVVFRVPGAFWKNLSFEIQLQVLVFSRGVRVPGTFWK